MFWVLFCFLFFCNVGWNYYCIKLRCSSDYANFHFTRRLFRRLDVPVSSKRCTSFSAENEWDTPTWHLDLLCVQGRRWGGKRQSLGPREDTIINKLCTGFRPKTACHTPVCIDQNSKTKTPGQPQWLQKCFLWAHDQIDTWQQTKGFQVAMWKLG